MHQPPQGQSIWGTINTCIEIALDVYAIIAKDQDGKEQQGLMVKKSSAEELLSKKAVRMGQESGEWLCYGKDTKGTPLYEILLHRIADCRRMEKLIMGQIGELKRDGIYLLNDPNSITIAIHEKVADQFLTPAAVGYGKKKEEYLLFDAQESAVALNELKNIFDEVAVLVISEDSLHASLHKNYPTYTSLYNQCMPETAQIPEVDAPVDLFLAGQLEAEQEAARTGERMGMEQGEPEWEFGEQVDYGIVG